MSLFSSIQMAGAALKANEIALQVVGQNIANANTPGYLRETANLVPGPSQNRGGLVQGSGVRVLSVTQQVDKYLESRLRTAISDQAGATTVKDTYAQLESIVGALGDNDSLGSAMNRFFNSISDVLNQPESTSMRQIATLQGQTLTRTLNEMASHTAELRAAIDGQISGMAVDINRLTAQIAQLNIRIAEVTGGGQLPSDAVGLTDQRNRALADLAELIGVQVNTQTDGSVSIYLNGSYLVDAGMARPLEVINSIDRGMTISTLQISDINTPVVPASGRLRGLISSRDEVLGEFQGRLDSLAGTLAFEFNKIYAGGQGMSAYSETTSLNAVSSPDASLSQAGLPFQPVNGSLKITTLNTLTGASMTTDIPVALLGRGHDTSLNSLAAEIDGIAGLDARVVNGKLTIAATDANTTFYFGADTSGALASLGINTFFAGSKAGDIAVNNTVLANPGKFAASSKGIGTDTTNAVTLARFLSMPLAAENGATLQSLYSSLVTDVTQSSAGATAAADAADTLQATLASQQMAVSGVNIDEEAVNLLAYQRAYQASARFISTINDLLTMLVQL